MKKLLTYACAIAVLTASCGDSNEESEKEEKANGETEEVVEDDAYDDEEEAGISKSDLYTTYPEAIGECPESSGITDASMSSGILKEFEGHDMPNRITYAEATMRESGLTPGSYILTIYMSNTDQYGIDRLSSGRIGDLDADDDFVLKVGCESSGLIMPGTYTGESDDMVFDHFGIFGKTESDDKFINNGMGTDATAELTITSISEDMVCGSFKFVGYDLNNVVSGTFACPWKMK